jgi:hypothetical protein
VNDFHLDFHLRNQVEIVLLWDMEEAKLVVRCAHWSIFHDEDDITKFAVVDQLAKVFDQRW